jgi:hypothetical protein
MIPWRVISFAINFSAAVPMMLSFVLAAVDFRRTHNRVPRTATGIPGIQ